MNISGVLVRSRPENIASVSERLLTIAGLEVHGANEDGRMVVTVESASDRALADTVEKLNEVPGVISTSMIYHQFEEDSQLEETLS